MPIKKLIPWVALLALIVLLIYLLSPQIFAPNKANEEPEPMETTSPEKTPEPTPAETEPPTVIVTFDDEGAITTQTVLQWEPLDLPEPAGKEGYTFFGWYDVENAIFPEISDQSLPLVDVTLYAVYCPTLGGKTHAPYLPMDASWRSRPDEPVTRADAISVFYGLTPLFAEDEQNAETEAADLETYREKLQSIGVALPDDAVLDEAITKDEFLVMLAPYFPEGYLLLSFGEESVGTDPVSRLDAARILNNALDRHGDKNRLAEARMIIQDLPENEEDAADLMEAILPHEYTCDTVTETWTSVELPELPLGEFTTGDLEVDAWIKGIFEERLKDGMTQREQLAALYRYVRDTSRYRKGDIHEEPDTAWVLAEARKMMEEGGGNCFTYSSTLCELYRALGVDAKIYAGTISEQLNPHAWVEANIDGTVYIFDVEMEATRLRFHHPYIDFFMRTYHDLKGWDYRRDFVVEWS